MRATLSALLRSSSLFLVCIDQQAVYRTGRVWKVASSVFVALPLLTIVTCEQGFPCMGDCECMMKNRFLVLLSAPVFPKHFEETIYLRRSIKLINRNEMMFESINA